MKTETKTDNIALAAEAALWLDNLYKRILPTFRPLFLDESRYLVLKGGGGSGKSIFAGQKILERAISEPKHRFLVCRKVARTLRESCFKQLVGQLAEYYPGEDYKINKSDMVIVFPNGSEIIFAGLDDSEKLKSIYEITDVWVEEASEITESDFNQLDIRMRGKSAYYSQFIVTFNPISIKHWLKKRFFDKREPDATTHHSTYKDNPFLPEASRRVLESFKDSDEYYYEVYCLGHWGVTGKTVFDGKAISKRLEDDLTPKYVGYFTYQYDGLSIKDITFERDKNGYVRIYNPPEDGVPYVIGGDTAGDGSDSFVAHVIDNRTGEQVAVLRHQFDEDVFAHQVFCLGMYYNTALVGIETNFSTYPVMELERLRYPKQYVREVMDDYTHSLRKAFGFNTNTKTRPVIIAELIRAVRDDINIVCDETTLDEMLTFVRGEDWKPQAEDGAHDDCVMALAIAEYIRPQQNYVAEPPLGAETVWSESMWEDYNAASPAEREYLLTKWGRPRK